MAAAAVVAAFTLLPLLHVVWYSAGVGLDVARAELFRPRMAWLLWHSVALALMVGGIVWVYAHLTPGVVVMTPPRP